MFERGASENGGIAVEGRRAEWWIRRPPGPRLSRSNLKLRSHAIISANPSAGARQTAKYCTILYCTYIL